MIEPAPHPAPRWLPSPGGFALWLYAMAFVVIPAVLAYQGFAYVIGIVIFGVGLRPHIVSLARGRHIDFGFRWGGEHYRRRIELKVASEKTVISITSWLMMLTTLLIVPFLAYVLQYQGRVFYDQVNTHLPAIIERLTALLDAAHARLPTLFPDVETVDAEGWQGVSALLSQVAGDAVADIKAAVKETSGNILSALGGLLADWVKLVVAAIIIGTMQASWGKEVKMHRAIISRGIRSEPLRANILRYGELYQEGVSLFMIGYLEVAVTLSLFFIIAMTVLPLGLSVGAILFMSVVLGFLTAIPKIGGFVAMGVAFLLMITNLRTGLGWFGWDIVSFGLVADVLIRTALLMAAAKLMGLLEAYSYTPEIIGERLGLTKMQIIATVVIWAVGAGFFGMIWGILLSLAFQAALRLSIEVEAAEPLVVDRLAE